MKTKIITGNFQLDIEGELNAEKQAEVVESGVTYIVQRDGLSAVYKELLEKGAKRDSLDFSEENAANIATALEKALAPYGTFVVGASQHTPSEGAAPRAMATAMWEQVKGNEQLRANLGVAADATDEQGVEACHTFLKGLRKTPERKAKNGEGK